SADAGDGDGGDPPPSQTRRRVVVVVIEHRCRGPPRDRPSCSRSQSHSTEERMQSQDQFELPFAPIQPASTSSPRSTTPPPITFADLPATIADAPPQRPIAIVTPSLPFASLQQAIAMRAYVDAL